MKLLGMLLTALSGGFGVYAVMEGNAGRAGVFAVLFVFSLLMCIDDMRRR